MFNILILIGIALLLGFGGGKYMERLNSPQVVGFILVGFFLGVSVLKVFDTALLEQLDIISFMALAFIGFDVGGELTIKLFKKLGKSIVVITVLQTFGTFLLVASAVFVYTRKLHIALVFGGFASATAPAATVLVLRECKASGVLTSTLFAVVALDDALAIILYSFASAFAKNVIGGGNLYIRQLILIPGKEIFGSLILGLLIGVILSRLILHFRSPEERRILTFGSIMLCAGLALQFELSLILANMALGTSMVNLLDGDKTAFNSVMDMSAPIYIVFFILVGAHLDIGLLSQLGVLSIIFIVFRTLGKYTGSYVGARASGAEEKVQKYLGLSLLPLGGVAVGLSIQAMHEFSSFGPAGVQLGLLGINVVAISVFVFEMIGPPATMYAIKKADECNAEKNILGDA